MGGVGRRAGRGKGRKRCAVARMDDRCCIHSFKVKDLETRQKTGRIYRIVCESGLTYIGQTTQELEERFQEHLQHPTNSRMRECLTGKARIELVHEFQFCRDEVLRDVEREFIERELAERGDVLNVQNVPAIQTEAAGVSPPKRRKPKFSLEEEETKRRFVVRCRSKAVDKLDQTRWFRYGRTDREAVRQAAEAWREQMARKYF